MVFKGGCMILKETAEFYDFIENIKANNLQIICYGSGLVALSIEDIFREYGIFDSIHCFIDSNPAKSGTCITLSGKDIKVVGIAQLLEMHLADKVILITASMYSNILEQLNQYKELERLPCYLYPTLNRSYIRSIVSAAQIPKTIHYCWFGGNEMSAFMLECISSWRKHNPEYSVVEWNESNYDVYKNRYVSQAYGAKKWAFVSDFARLDILYEHGGIYLDTDVKVYKNFDSLLHNKAFIGYNEWPMVNSAVCGSVPGLEIIKAMRDNPRGTMDFFNPDGSPNLTINSVYETDVLKSYGFIKDFSYQTINGMAIYPPCFFAQSGKLGVNADIDERTYTVHYPQNSWISTADKEVQNENRHG